MKIVLRWFLPSLVLVATAPSAGVAQQDGESFFKRDFAGSPLGESGGRSKSQNAEQPTRQMAPKQPTAVASFDEIGAPDAESSASSSPATSGGEMLPEMSAGRSSVNADVGQSESQGAKVSSIANSGSASSQVSAAPSVSSKPPQSESDDASRVGVGDSMGRGIKIERIGLVANFLNEDHALEALTAYREVLLEHSLEPGTIYMIGVTPGIIMDALVNMVRRLQFLGVGFASNQVLPPVPVKLSPSWIVETATGRYLVEGTMNLDRFLNARGEFIKPGDAELPLGAETVAPEDLVAASSSSTEQPANSNDATSSVKPNAKSASGGSSAASSERQGIVPELR